MTELYLRDVLHEPINQSQAAREIMINVTRAHKGSGASQGVLHPHERIKTAEEMADRATDSSGFIVRYHLMDSIQNNRLAHRFTNL